jgi:hypothetical protein
LDQLIGKRPGGVIVPPIASPPPRQGHTGREGGHMTYCTVKVGQSGTAAGSGVKPHLPVEPQGFAGHERRIDEDSAQGGSFWD